MTPELKDYIIPTIVIYHNIDDLLEKNYHHSLLDTAKKLSLDELLKENFVCIVGEPGIGKSKLLKKIKEHIS